MGNLRIFRAEKRIEMDSSRKKGLQILLWFLLNPGRPCSAEQFIDMLWPGTNSDKAIGRFDVSMHAVKRLLEPDLAAREESVFIQHHSNRVYSFEGADLWWNDLADLDLLYGRGHA